MCEVRVRVYGKVQQGHEHDHELRLRLIIQPFCNYSFVLTGRDNLK